MDTAKPLKDTTTVVKQVTDRKWNPWGFVYLVIGIVGLSFSVYSTLYDLLNIVPIYGTVMAGLLIGVLSLFIIIYGVRIIKRDI